ncbi:MAG: Ig-like domain-containing protein [Candidatus Binatia bacterium]
MTSRDKGRGAQSAWMMWGLGIGLGLLLAGPAWASHDDEQDCHPNQPGCTEDGEILLKFTKPATELKWQLAKRAHLWVDAWRTHQNNSKPWPKETYDPRYVYPETFEAQFRDQCQNQTDWDYYVNSIGSLEGQAGRYQWSVNGVVQVAAGDCFLQQLWLPGEGIHDVKLEVFKPGAATPYLTKNEDVRVRDYLIVLFGDSAASGEGSPDLQRPTNSEWGSWVDRRCHRSAWAAVPQAVQELENDPHSTVTFLNFACSGATLKHWEPGQGVGILDRYAGIEPTAAAAEYGDNDPTFYLPSQVDQLSVALRTEWPNNFVAEPRKVDMLFTTGGINDVRFAKLALACVLLEECHNVTTSLFDAEANAVRFVFDDLAARIPEGYVELRDALVDEGIDVKETFVMQYPGAFESDDGSQCQVMLEDVLPPDSVWNLVLNPLIGPAVLTTTVLGPFLEYEIGVNFPTVLVNALTGDLEWSPDEIDWMVDNAMPTLDQALRDGAQAAGFTFIDGIQQAFAKHGYCANDNWIRRADEASFVQGPWNIVSKPLNVPPLLDPTEDLGLGIQALTKGLMHPGTKGYDAWAKVLRPTMAKLRNHAPVAKSDVYTLNTASDPVFDTGFGAGVLLNDFDPDDDPIRAQMLKGPNYGTATLTQEGRLVYTPNAGFSGFDSVYYNVSDGGLISQTVKATIGVGNSRLPGNKWKWNIPSGEETPVVEIGGIAEFPVCNNCGDLVLRIDPERQPGFGKVTFERVKDRWLARYVQNGSTPRELPYLDILALQIGRTALGAFQREGSAEIPVRIVGTEPPPATWSWIFETPERVLVASETQFDLCDSCGDLEVRVTVEPQSGEVAVRLDTERDRWVATYSHNPASELAGDGFGVEIGSINEAGFTPLDATRVSLFVYTDIQ